MEKLAIVGWSIYLCYQLAIIIHYEVSDIPICSATSIAYPPFYWNMLYCVFGGSCITLVSILIRFFTTREYDPNRYFLYWISLHISSISCITTLLMIHNWGGICIDGLHVASSAVRWGEWLACSPILLFITVTLTNKEVTTSDRLLVLSFSIALLLGYLMIYASYVVSMFLLCGSILCATPTILIYYYYKTDHYDNHKTSDFVYSFTWLY